MSDPADEPTASTGPPDRQTLRLLERQRAADPLVVETDVDPNPHEPRLLSAHLDPDGYPASIV